MGRGASPAQLPKVSFTKVSDEASTQPAGVHDMQARSYGYNDIVDFRRPEHYVRYIEPLESELAVQGLTAADQEWLDVVNSERKKEQIDVVSYETFEIIMDRLEKEWFDLTKNIPKPDMALPSEDSTCAICDDSEGENTNAIVFCDGCNLAVHQDCYGVPYIPEGQWLCRKCTVSPENPVSCILCPNEGGAFKQTSNGEWVHLLCAIWVPETLVVNEVFMEPITGVEKITKPRWSLKCTICGVRQGACIQCSKTQCSLAFHVTCARKERYLLPMKATSGSEPPPLQCFCERHIPRENAIARLEAIAAEAAQTPVAASDLKSNKSARAYAKSYKPGPPIVPALIVNRINQYINKIKVRRRTEFIELVCRYWSLKREARRGAPLLKRLHLEPWTASANGRVQTEEERAIKLEHMKRLKQDLETVRSLAELTRKRESRKLKQMEIIHELLTTYIFPHESRLRFAFEKIMILDRNEYFKNPVSQAQVPDYLDIVKRPMWWGAIEAKLDRHEYWDLETFKGDVFLVLDNATLYNKHGTTYYKTAARIKAAALPILTALDDMTTSAKSEVTLPAANASADSVHPEEASSSTHLVGNLEPPLQILSLLASMAIDSEFEFILTSHPLQYLFSYEFPELKPPPPPPPPKPRRDRKKAERERRVATAQAAAAQRAAIAHAQKVEAERQELEAAEARDIQEKLNASSGFRGPPRTRRASKYEAEVTEGIDAAPASSAQGDEVHPEAIAEASTEGGSAEVTASKRKKHKRLPIELPGHGEPPVVSDVDPKSSFKNFDKGWILDVGTRRGGRVPIERGPLPPPKKRAKHGPAPTVETPASSSTVEAQYPQPTEAKPGSIAEGEPLLTARSEVDEPMAVDEQQADEPISSAQAHEDEPLPSAQAQADHSTQAEDDEPMQEETMPLAQSEGDDPTPPDHLEVEPMSTDQAQEDEPIPPAQLQEADEVASTEPSQAGDPPPVAADVPEVTMEEAVSEVSPIPAPSIAASSPPSALADDRQPSATESAIVPQSIDLADLQIELEPNEVLRKDPDGKLVIEELDTPITRRQKAQRKKAKFVAAQAEAGPSRIAGLDGDSELSSLSEMESDSDDDNARSSKARTGPKKKKGKSGPKGKIKWGKRGPEAGRFELKEGEMLPGGTLAWAKFASFPWWAAVIVEPDDPLVTPFKKVLKDRPSPSDSGPHLVRFYDKDLSWAWLHLDDLRMLGDDDEFDQFILYTQRYKSNNIRDSCRASYRVAMSERESDGGGDEEEVDDEEPIVEED
ncbi:hypothetical protein FA95DRAFT_1589126 [Auriscalpium vulgare]|uniref:Uncharacterized protein n=1 Tax=Auriscalpium vulgare TaxID=40419 RepID=A0ACB8RUU0_9AGAM|nr:hypothetical protein FA95DRAFT_1589126 [Auriscalpium vulgare]